MSSIEPFEDGINGDSMVRRLKNVERKCQKTELKTARERPERIQDSADSSQRHLQLTSSNQREDKEHPRRTRSQDQSPQDFEDGFKDEGGDVSPSVAALRDGRNGDFWKDILAEVNDPDTQWIPADPNDPNLRTASFYRREDEEEMKKKGIRSASRISSVHSSEAQSSGYIPPPEQRTPGGTKMWNYRDYQAYVIPFGIS